MHKNRGTLYNQPLLPGPITLVGRTAVAVTGFLWGLCRSLRGEEDGNEIHKIREVDARLARIESTLDRLSATVANPSSVARQRSAHDGASHTEAEGFVTRDELAEALSRTEKRLAENVASQFERQTVAIGTLRAMIVDTDALLERVLDHLETSAEGGFDGDSGDPAGGSDDEKILSLKDPVRN